MVRLPRTNRLSFILLLGMTALVILGMLYFGIRFKGFRPINNVKWNDSGVGLRFDRFGIVYAQGFFSSSAEGSQKDSLTIEMAIKPVFNQYSDFRYVLLIHNGDDAKQLVVGQYRTSLVVMNGNDHSNRRKTPKIYVQLDGEAHKDFLVTIVSNQLGTRLFLNGRLVSTNKHLRLKYPNPGEQTKMLVGNSLYGNNPWRGTMLGLALYDFDLSEKVISNHYQKWRDGLNFNAFRAESPRLLYAFDQRGGEKVHNVVSGGEELDLIVPVWMSAPKKKILGWPVFNEMVSKESLTSDVLVNLFGFIPLGFLLLATLGRLEGFNKKYTILILGVLVAFLFSFSIEIAQVWIPSRDSSILDLVLNSFGGLLGGLAYLVLNSILLD